MGSGDVFNNWTCHLMRGTPIPGHHFIMHAGIINGTYIGRSVNPQCHVSVMTFTINEDNVPIVH